MYSAPLIEHAKKYLNLDKIEIQLCEEWSSQFDDSRIKIRKYIFEHFEPNEQLLDLNLTPNLLNFSLSISHNKLLGGFALTSRSINLGFDVEVKDRVRIDLVARVSKKQELETAPGAAALWVAKEAAFKSLRGEAQPKTLSEVEIGDWCAVAPNTYSCRILNKDSENFSGLVYMNSQQAYSLFRN